MRPARLVLLAIAAAFALAGGVLVLLPPALHTEELPPPSSSPPPTLGPGAATYEPAVAEDIILANVFSPQRRAPSARYVPPESGMDSPGSLPRDTSLPDENITGGDDGAPRLFGTVVGSDGARALLQLDPALPGARSYAVGDRDGGYRVLAISPRTVVLVGPRGRVTLQLDQEEDDL